MVADFSGLQFENVAPPPEALRWPNVRKRKSK
jgi:hypothetical protein